MQAAYQIGIVLECPISQNGSVTTSVKKYLTTICSQNQLRNVIVILSSFVQGNGITGMCVVLETLSHILDTLTALLICTNSKN